ncbi:hypothetical protein AB0H76_10370 [Nocardia sp. NPDC050712]|uniref:hypothetical protein n=1 Tax=Nocardia sp. NPDC050712 TaxID=3155518 RepID=UPI0033C449F4
MRHPAEAAARLRSATPYRPLRGAFIGSASGAVSIAAHALGGGVVAPGDSSIALLLAACGLIGVTVGAPRHSGTGARRSGLAELVLLLMAGQAIGHTALTLAPAHQHGSHAGAVMLLAHLVAVPVGALLIRAAELGLTRAAASVRKALRALVTRPARLPAARASAAAGPVRTARRLLLSSGIGSRGPPAYC